MKVLTVTPYLHCIFFLLTFYLQLVNSRFTSVFFAEPTWFYNQTSIDIYIYLYILYILCMPFVLQRDEALILKTFILRIFNFRVPGLKLLWWKLFEKQSPLLLKDTLIIRKSICSKIDCCHSGNKILVVPGINYSLFNAYGCMIYVHCGTSVLHNSRMQKTHSLANLRMLLVSVRHWEGMLPRA